MKTKIFTLFIALFAIASGAKADVINATKADVGKVVCSDGSIYATVSAATAAGKTAAVFRSICAHSFRYLCDPALYGLIERPCIGFRKQTASAYRRIHCSVTAMTAQGGSVIRRQPFSSVTEYASGFTHSGASKSLCA